MAAPKRLPAKNLSTQIVFFQKRLRTDRKSDRLVDIEKTKYKKEKKDSVEKKLKKYIEIDFEQNYPQNDKIFVPINYMAIEF